MTDLYVEEHGDGEPVLLITGLGYAVWSWAKQIPSLAERFRVVAFDNRGTGRSPKTAGPYSIDGLADDAAGVLDGRRAHVVGHSMGGYIALTLALRHPDLVRSLVLAGTGGGGPGYVPIPAATLEIWLASAGLPPEEYVRRTMYLSFAPGWTEEHPDEYERLIAARLEYPTPPETWRAQFDAATRFVETGVPLEDIDVPALVIHGDQDRVVPVENGRELARRMLDARLLQLPGRGHVMQLEDPDTFNGAVLEFLS